MLSVGTKALNFLEFLGPRGTFPGGFLMFGRSLAIVPFCLKLEVHFMAEIKGDDTKPYGTRQ